MLVDENNEPLIYTLNKIVYKKYSEYLNSSVGKELIIQGFVKFNNYYQENSLVNAKGYDCIIT